MRADVAVRWASIRDAPLDDDALDAPARTRCSRLHHPADRRRFVGARMLLRHAVAELTGCRPGDVGLRQRCARCGGPHGRPAVDVRTGPGPLVSFSHAGDLAVVAVASRPVGVDVEPVHVVADARRWVRGEAVLKATGHGLEVDQDQLDMSPSEAAPVLRGWRGPGPRPSLRIVDLDLAAGYVAALARAGRRPLHVDVREHVLPFTR